MKIKLIVFGILLSIYSCSERNKKEFYSDGKLKSINFNSSKNGIETMKYNYFEDGKIKTIVNVYTNHRLDSLYFTLSGSKWKYVNYDQGTIKSKKEYFIDGYQIDKYFEDGSMKSHYVFSNENLLLKKKFYRKGEISIYSSAGYTVSGKLDLSPKKTHFVLINSKNDKLLLTPIGIREKNYDSSRIIVLSHFPSKDGQMNIIRTVQNSDITNLEYAYMKSDIIDKKIKLIIELYKSKIDPDIGRIVQIEQFFLQINDIKNPPKNNLNFIE